LGGGPHLGVLRLGGEAALVGDVDALGRHVLRGELRQVPKAAHRLRRDGEEARLVRLLPLEHLRRGTPQKTLETTPAHVLFRRRIHGLRELRELLLDRLLADRLADVVLVLYERVDGLLLGA
jgi:hypothetical protein